MLSSAIPALLSAAFANAGQKNTISVGSNSPQASLADGFPPVTMTPLASGGVPPDGKDFNGILNWITQLEVWMNSGGLFPFNSGLCTAIGGYPKGVVLQSNDKASAYVSLIENNTYDPNTPANIGTYWAPWAGAAGDNGQYAVDSGAVNALVVAMNPPITAYAKGAVCSFKVAVTNTGACTINAGGGAVALVRNDGTAMQAGDLIAGAVYTAVYDATLGKFMLLCMIPSQMVPYHQIQPVTASVASNALTVGLNSPTTLDMRSSSLTNSTVNARTLSSPITLTVPAGATLGTTSGQAARLVLLALDNAGTLEMAIANLSGGVNLDETTLISTIAISGSSNSSGAVYSNAARSNVPFRVVGYIDITEATAGTWATAHTAIQGCGGQALAALSSLGYGQTVQNVAGSRAIATGYYNTTGRPIFVMVTLTSTVASTIQVTVNGISFYGSTGYGASQRDFAAFIVPPGGSYSVGVDNGTGSVVSWVELR